MTREKEKNEVIVLVCRGVSIDDMKIVMRKIKQASIVSMFSTKHIKERKLYSTPKPNKLDSKQRLQHTCIRNCVTYCKGACCGGGRRLNNSKMLENSDGEDGEMQLCGKGGNTKKTETNSL